MSFAVKRLSLAEADAFQSARWYDEQRAGLGDDFLDELAAVTDALARNALLHAIRFADVRHSNDSANTACFTFWTATR